MIRLDEIEARLKQNAVPDPHPEDYDCRECSDARDIQALVSFARSVRYAENQGDLADSFITYLGFNPYEETDDD